MAVGATITATMFVIHVAVVPLAFKYSKCLQRKMVFSNCINYPPNLNYESPSSVEIMGGRNLCINFTSTVDKCPIKIGIWHIIPDSLLHQNLALHKTLEHTTNTVLLYCHGNSNHRASPHRRQMYRVFQLLDFHVITFDYRGYGDSSAVRPTESGVVEDCLRVYEWLLDSLDPGHRPPVVLWGHSLGSSVASNMVAHMSQLCSQHCVRPLPPPAALVLESPFNNLLEEIREHPCSKLFTWLPYYHTTFVKPLALSPEFSFSTDQYLSRVPQLPILMLHCKGDQIVPYRLAEKLHATVQRSREPGSAALVFHSYEKDTALGHNTICEACDLASTVKNFLETCVKKRQE